MAEKLSAPTKLNIFFSVLASLFLIIVIDTAFFTLLVLTLILIVGAEGYHISIYK